VPYTERPSRNTHSNCRKSWIGKVDRLRTTSRPRILYNANNSLPCNQHNKPRTPLEQHLQRRGDSAIYGTLGGTRLMSSTSNADKRIQHSRSRYCNATPTTAVTPAHQMKLQQWWNHCPPGQPYLSQTVGSSRVYRRLTCRQLPFPPTMMNR
jgi:hypothetical protein